jgi:adenine deaminase
LYEVDKVALPAYPAKHGLGEWVRIAKAKDTDTMPFNDFGQVNVITLKPTEVLAALEDTMPELAHTVLYRRRDFHKVLLLDRYGRVRERTQPRATL